MSRFLSHDDFANPFVSEPVSGQIEHDEPLPREYEAEVEVKKRALQGGPGGCSKAKFFHLAKATALQHGLQQFRTVEHDAGQVETANVAVPHLRKDPRETGPKIRKLGQVQSREFGERVASQEAA